MSGTDWPRGVGRFEWDEWNTRTIRDRHGVQWSEAEEVFLNSPLVIQEDSKHSQTEPRWYALGHTNRDRRLFLAFTVRGDAIRIISARDMSRKERKVYSDEEESGSQV